MAAKTEQETLLRITNGAAIAVAALALLWMSLLGYVVVKDQASQNQVRQEAKARTQAVCVEANRQIDAFHAVGNHIIELTIKAHATPEQVQQATDFALFLDSVAGPHQNCAR